MPGAVRSTPACIGIGSNIDHPVRQVYGAIIRLRALPGSRVRAVSSLYRNPPMGPADQPDFVNAVALLDTRLAPATLLALLLEAEVRQGRSRAGIVRWGPRRIDLDLLTYGDSEIDRAGLRIPHPGISERNFVLLPLLEIAPHLEIAGAGPVRQLAAGIDSSSLERLR